MTITSILCSTIISWSICLLLLEVIPLIFQFKMLRFIKNLIVLQRVETRQCLSNTAKLSFLIDLVLSRIFVMICSKLALSMSCKAWIIWTISCSSKPSCIWYTLNRSTICSMMSLWNGKLFSNGIHVPVLLPSPFSLALLFALPRIEPGGWISILRLFLGMTNVLPEKVS